MHVYCDLGLFAFGGGVHDDSRDIDDDGGDGGGGSATYL